MNIAKRKGNEEQACNMYGEWKSRSLKNKYRKSSAMQDRKKITLSKIITLIKENADKTVA